MHYRSSWMTFLYFRKQCGVNASECYEWPGVDVLRQRVLNAYALIPVMFLLRSHTAEFRQFTGNVTTSHTVNCQNEFTSIFEKVLFTHDLFMAIYR